MSETATTREAAENVDEVEPVPPQDRPATPPRMIGPEEFRELLRAKVSIAAIAREFPHVGGLLESFNKDVCSFNEVWQRVNASAGKGWGRGTRRHAENSPHAIANDRIIHLERALAQATARADDAHRRLDILESRRDVGYRHDYSRPREDFRERRDDYRASPRGGDGYGYRY